MVNILQSHGQLPNSQIEFECKEDKSHKTEWSE